jgi:hypothetical protein
MRYVEIEADLNLNLARLLILVSATTGNKSESILTLERLVIYEFLARNPILLLKLLRQMGKKHKIEAREYEAGGLSSKYYNKSSIYSFESIRNLIQLLFVRNMVIISGLAQDQVTVSTTTEGNSFCLELRQDYYQRYFEVGAALKALNSTSTVQLRSQINLLINV